MATRSCTRRGAATITTLVLVATMASSPAQAADATPTPTKAASMRASALLPWHLSPSLVALRAEVNRRWPYRDRSSDGSIGDAYHAARTNSHNPVGRKGGPDVGTIGAVHALDITASGIDTTALLNSVIGDSRVWYVIYNGRIWSRTTGWAARPQSGDPHTTHIHINLREDSQSVAVKAEKDASRWLSSSGGRGSSAKVANRTSRATKVSLSTTTTRKLQKALIKRGFRIPSGATGWYGPETTRAVKAFQKAQGWSGSGADGIAGAQTLARLGVTGSDAKATKAKVTKTTKAKKSTTAKATTKASLAKYKPGTATREIYFLQQALIQKGYDIPAGPTGYFGAKTVAAVKKFQRAQGWPASQCDGVPGKQTLKLLGLA